MRASPGRSRGAAKVANTPSFKSQWEATRRHIQNVPAQAQGRPPKLLDPPDAPRTDAEYTTAERLWAMAQASAEAGPQKDVPMVGTPQAATKTVVVPVYVPVPVQRDGQVVRKLHPGYDARSLSPTSGRGSPRVSLTPAPLPGFVFGAPPWSPDLAAPGSPVVRSRSVDLGGAASPSAPSRSNPGGVGAPGAHAAVAGAALAETSAASVHAASLSQPLKPDGKTFNSTSSGASYAWSAVSTAAVSTPAVGLLSPGYGSPMRVSPPHSRSPSPMARSGQRMMLLPPVATAAPSVSLAPPPLEGAAQEPWQKQQPQQDVANGGPLQPQSTEDLAVQCVCGHRYSDDELFCRKCGTRRAAARLARLSCSGSKENPFYLQGAGSHPDPEALKTRELRAPFGESTPSSAGVLDHGCVGKQEALPTSMAELREQLQKERQREQDLLRQQQERQQRRQQELQQRRSSQQSVSIEFATAALQQRFLEGQIESQNGYYPSQPSKQPPPVLEHSNHADQTKQLRTDQGSPADLASVEPKSPTSASVALKFNAQHALASGPVFPGGESPTARTTVTLPGLPGSEEEPYEVNITITARVGDDAQDVPVPGSADAVESAPVAPHAGNVQMVSRPSLQSRASRPASLREVSPMARPKPLVARRPPSLQDLPQSREASLPVVYHGLSPTARSVGVTPSVVQRTSPRRLSAPVSFLPVHQALDFSPRAAVGSWWSEGPTRQSSPSCTKVVPQRGWSAEQPPTQSVSSRAVAQPPFSWASGEAAPATPDSAGLPGAFGQRRCPRDARQPATATRQLHELTPSMPARSVARAMSPAAPPPNVTWRAAQSNWPQCRSLSPTRQLPPRVVSARTVRPRMDWQARSVSPQASPTAVQRGPLGADLLPLPEPVLKFDQVPFPQPVFKFEKLPPSELNSNFEKPPAAAAQAGPVAERPKSTSDDAGTLFSL